MPHRSDPYIDDPDYGDPPIVNRYGRRFTRSRLNSGGGLSTRAMVGVGAILIIFALAYYGWNVGKTGPDFAESVPTTIGQTR